MGEQPGHRILLIYPGGPDRPLSGDEFRALAAYNSECSNGLAHTPAWVDLMAELQRRYDLAGHI